MLVFLIRSVILLLLFTDTAKAVLKKQAYGYVLYVCAYYLYITLVCLLFSTAIPTSLFNLEQLFFIFVTIFYDLRSFRYFTEIDVSMHDHN